MIADRQRHLEILEWALWYARQGIPVFRLHAVFDGLCTCSKGVDCPENQRGKHPRTQNGFKDAITDEETIRSWDWSRSNIGVCTGYGLVVIDFDPRNVTDFAAVWDLLNRLPFTWTVQTGGGGAHFYYFIDSAIELRKYDSLGGLEIKGLGTCVAGIGSNHRFGTTYTALVENDITFLDDLYLLPPRNNATDDSRVVRTDTKFPFSDLHPGQSEYWEIRSKDWLRTKQQGSATILKGTRNKTVKRLFGELQRHGLAPEDQYAIIDSINDTQCVPSIDSFSSYNTMVDWMKNESEIVPYQCREILPEITLFEHAIDHYPWTGRSKRVRNAILRYLLEVAKKTNSMIIHCAFTTIESYTGIASQTIRIHVEAMEGEWLDRNAIKGCPNPSEYILKVPPQFIGMDLAVFYKEKGNNLSNIEEQKICLLGLSGKIPRDRLLSDQFSKRGSYGSISLSILSRLSISPIKTLTELAKDVHTSLSYVSKKVKVLIKDGYITKDRDGYHVTDKQMTHTYDKFEKTNLRLKKQREVYQRRLAKVNDEPVNPIHVMDDEDVEKLQNTNKYAYKRLMEARRKYR